MYLGLLKNDLKFLLVMIVFDEIEKLDLGHL